MNVADRPETQVMPVDGGDASDLDRDRRGLAAVGETCDRSGATCQASALPPRGDHDDGSADDPPARQEIEAACAKVLSSRTFLHSARHRAFLRFVVQAALEGRAECLTEVAIGREIFGCVLNGRDAGRDPIVRVEARRLRLKLQRYYENEGRDDVLQIGLPGRTYAPTFQTRRRGAGPADGEALVLVLPFVVYGVEAARSTISIGLANQLIDLFESRPGIRVAASIIATELCERSVPFDTLRGVHGIDYVIDGSIITEGSRMRCVAHLSRTRDGRRLWSSRFDTPRAGSVASGPAASDDAGPLAFQDRIAMQVVAAVVRECGTA